MIRKSFLSLLLLFPLLTWAQSEGAEVKVSVQPAEFKVGDKVRIVAEVSPRQDWYVYSITPSENGAYVETSMGFELESRGFDSEGKMEEKGPLSQEYDEIMEATLRYFKAPVAFSQEITITEPNVTVVGYLDYMACNGFKCVLFTQEFKLELKANE
jgi:hypothetical protein